MMNRSLLLGAGLFGFGVFFNLGLCFGVLLTQEKDLYKPRLPLQAYVVSVQQLKPGQWSDPVVWMFFCQCFV